MTAPSDRRAIITEALRKIDDLTARLAIAEKAETEPIAVVGIGCRLPGGVDNADQSRQTGMFPRHPAGEGKTNNERREKMAPEDKMEIARTIWQQLGGGRFSIMTGASRPIALENGIQVRFPGRKVNLVTITLDPFDTYTMTFQRFRKRNNLMEFESKTVAEHTDVYADQLQNVFKSVTGLETRL